MTPNALVFSAFTILSAAAFFRSEGPSRIFRRSRGEWLADGAGLLVQGVVVPFVETALVYAGLYRFFPQLRGAVAISPITAFALNFVLVDYLYYWNHRLLHGALWPWHALHHSAEDLDVWVTSRNTLWTPVLIVYIWINGLFAFILKDPSAYLMSAAITAALDLWRHSGAWPADWTLPLLITPREHAWHHSAERFDRNFGANLKLWDRLHGTHFDPRTAPGKLGLAVPGGALRALAVGAAR